MFKRIVDLSIGIALIPIGIVPVLISSSLIILCEKQNPLFVQKRVGLNSKPFKIYKLTTMRKGTITKIGKFLRASRIDELPQAFNLINGTMSFIGPRPETVERAVKYTQEIPSYYLRHRIKPGLTGLAQITQGHFTESVSATKRKVAYDLFYIKHQSLWLNLFIVFKTIQTVLQLKGK